MMLMINSIGGGFNGVAVNRAALAKSGATAFAGALALARSSNATEIQVSDSPATVVAEQEPASASSTVRNSRLAADADAISSSQGLAKGKYDFTSMTSKQLITVVDNMVENGRGSDESINGLRVQSLFARMALDSGTPDQAHNVRDDLIKAVNFAQSTGDISNYKRWTQSLVVLDSINDKKINVTA